MDLMFPVTLGQSPKVISIIHIILPVNHLNISVFDVLSIYNRHFLPFRRRPNLSHRSHRVGWVGICFIAAHLR